MKDENRWFKISDDPPEENPNCYPTAAFSRQLAPAAPATSPHRRAIFFMIYMLLFGFFISIAISVMFLLVEMYIPLDRRFIATSPTFLVLMQLVALLLPMGIWIAIFREKVTVATAPLDKKNIVYILAISLLLVPITNVISGLTMFFFPNDIAPLMMDAFANHGFVPLLIALAVTPAICEELIFRGYIQSVYRYRAFLTMALLNGLFFAVMHSSPQQFAYTFAMGVVWAYMVHITGSLRAGVLAHFVMNATSVTFAFLGTRLADVLSDYADLHYAPQMDETAELILAIAFWGVIALFTTTFAAVLFAKFHKHNKKSPPPPTEIIPQTRKDRAIDAALIAVLLALYVLLTF